MNMPSKMQRGIHIDKRNDTNMSEIENKVHCQEHGSVRGIIWEGILVCPYHQRVRQTEEGPVRMYGELMIMENKPTVSRMSTCQGCGHEVIEYKGIWLHVRWEGNRHMLPRIPYGVVKCLQGSKAVSDVYHSRCGCMDPVPTNKIISR